MTHLPLHRAPLPLRGAVPDRFAMLSPQALWFVDWRDAFSTSARGSQSQAAADNARKKRVVKRRPLAGPLSIG
jgi:hypothetical protein